MLRFLTSSLCRTPALVASLDQFSLAIGTLSWRFLTSSLCGQHPSLVPGLNQFSISTGRTLSSCASCLVLCVDRHSLWQLLSTSTLWPQEPSLVASLDQFSVSTGTSTFPTRCEQSWGALYVERDDRGCRLRPVT